MAVHGGAQTAAAVVGSCDSSGRIARKGDPGCPSKAAAGRVTASSSESSLEMLRRAAEHVNSVASTRLEQAFHFAYKFPLCRARSWART
eukprot:scaffold21444_cov30-Prasinocladus_malaysianus.AAC.2